ncbi:glucan biosynthesis protein G [Alsobacter sp. SYSU M60028]|uniref:Glucans biosynthesis protein G n=1 Tax=Alsobacter ponti TaxID=2962936 RepID=A0ABT1LDY0_9HYPH|nr:glucan biosynthesis protein G [Alsobacter ponti]MCP8939705.1 glucan biosynthesis protein G [Alsobacter ponti]
MHLDRRTFVERLAGLAAALLAAPASAQSPSGPGQPAGAPAQARFGYDDVVRRARDLATLPYDATPQPLPEQLARLDFDSYRDIRFKPDRALLGGAGGAFRMQMFHPGFLFPQPVTVNVIRDGIAAPVPYSASLFDYGRNKFDRPLPVNLGFAGFRLHYPLNDPKVYDELISFLGASYFRFLGRRQRYGLSARGLAIGVGARETEEFPIFREFWIEQPAPDAERAVIYALLDGASLTGAYQFLVYPEQQTVVDVSMTLFPRRPIPRIGIAPLTSMFYVGENDKRYFDDFRPELHDSDGLLVHAGSGEWIWRPLRNAREIAISSFMDTNPRGFGLMQRDRIFEHYQDLDLGYEARPSYWVEPRGSWGEGRIELVEIPTGDETNDNIVAYWTPSAVPEPGQTLVWAYRIRAITDDFALHPGGAAYNTWQTSPRALGSSEQADPNTRRFIIDFAGGDLAYYLGDPERVQIVPSVSNGRILRTFLSPNPRTKGFRAGIDVAVEKGQSADLRAFLKAGNRALTETWTFPWRPE